jgi:uncharacterized Tic20 family protein
VGNEAFLVIAGLVAPFVIQIIKTVFGDLEGKEALWATFGVSVVFAVAAGLLSGYLIAPAGDQVAVTSSVLTQFGTVLGLATAIYKLFISQPAK